MDTKTDKATDTVPDNITVAETKAATGLPVLITFKGKEYEAIALSFKDAIAIDERLGGIENLYRIRELSNLAFVIWLFIRRVETDLTFEAFLESLSARDVKPMGPIALEILYLSNILVRPEPEIQAAETEEGNAEAG